jgi:hypothetical protein
MSKSTEEDLTKLDDSHMTAEKARDMQKLAFETGELALRILTLEREVESLEIEDKVLSAKLSSSYQQFITIKEESSSILSSSGNISTQPLPVVSSSPSSLKQQQPRDDIQASLAHQEE